MSNSTPAEKLQAMANIDKIKHIYRLVKLRAIRERALDIKDEAKELNFNDLCEEV